MKNFSRRKMLTIVSLASIVLVASVAFAQTGTTTQENQNKARGEWGGHKRGGHREGFGQRGFGGEGFGRGGAMFRELNLTEDQQNRMKQIRESFGERTKSLREQLRAKQQELHQATDGGTFNEALITQKLTEEAGLKARMMGEQFKLHQEMLTVLTAEQRTQMEQLREQFKTKRSQFKANRGERLMKGGVQNQ
jgi:periplasmic protein CpxP/Spy